MGNTIKTINRLSLTARHVYIGLLRFAQQSLPIVSRSRRRPRYSFRVCHPAGKSLAIDFPDFNSERLLAQVNITAPHYPGQIIVIEAVDSQVAALPSPKTDCSRRVDVAIVIDRPYATGKAPLPLCLVGRDHVVSGVYQSALADVPLVGDDHAGVGHGDGRNIEFSNDRLPKVEAGFLYGGIE